MAAAMTDIRARLTDALQGSGYFSATDRKAVAEGLVGLLLTLPGIAIIELDRVDKIAEAIARTWPEDRFAKSWPWSDIPERDREAYREMARAALLAAANLSESPHMADPVNHPSHYRHPSGIECIEITRHCPFNLGNAIKYIWRSSDKNGIEDLLKARWYLTDVMATGQAHHPPHKAKVLLTQVIADDDDPIRTVLLYRVMHGQLNAAIEKIDQAVADA